MKKNTKFQKKNQNRKLSIPIYNNSNYQYRKINNHNPNTNPKIYNCNPKNIIINQKKASNCITPMRRISKLNAYEKAEIESNITNQLLSKKYQTILQRDKDIKHYLTTENNEIKKDIVQEKIKLKEDLSKLINDTINLSKNIKVTQGKISSVDNKVLKMSNSQLNLRQKNIEFLNELGINLEALNGKKTHIINIDKVWNYINKIKKGKNNIDDILRYKIVNSILNINEKNMYCKKINKQRTPCNNIKTNANRVQCKRIIRKKKIDEPKNNEIKNKSKMNLSIPFDNNRIRMIEILNRSYNYPTIINDDRNESQANNKKDLEIQIDN
jgi:hypothetical protein